jgi:non-specific serine/threonine protein kinase
VAQPGEAVVEKGSFGSLLRQFRLAASLSQEALAERAQLSATAIAALERGRRGAPRPGTLRLLADALELDQAQRNGFVEAAQTARMTIRERLNGPPQPQPTSPRRTHNLPAELTRFIGRVQESSQVAQALLGTRLLTLTGAGGIGKTRLALRVAADAMDRFADGVWLVDLMPLHDPGVLESEVAHVLGVHEASRPPLESLLDWCQPRQLLLVLDSCEHLIDACADLAHRLLVSAPGLRIIATSREPLSISGETIWRVPPLTVPPPESSLSPEAMAELDAVQLFLDRAQATGADFHLTSSNAAAVAELCSRLEGVPFAIQLAAAWVGTLTVDQIVARLDDCIRLLTHGSRIAPTRQQTLRATLDWSHELLSEAEQRLFRRLTVFDGTFALEAAEAVCSGDGLGREQVLNLLARLVDTSLVVAESRPDGRHYRLAEPVWQYAYARLVESGELDRLHDRHATFYLELAEEAAPELAGPTQAVWLDRLEREHANIRAALTWQHEHGDPEWRALRLVSAIWRFWWLRSYFGEGRAQLQGLLRLAGESPPPRIRARALLALGELTFRQGDVAAARPPLEVARDLFWEAEDDLGVALALRSLGRLALDEGDHTSARTMLEEDLRIERQLEHRAGIPWSLTYLGWLAIFEGRHHDARTLLDESLQLCIELGDREGIGRAFFSLGHLALDLGQLAEARSRFRESLGLFDALSYKYGIVYALEGLADVAAAEGDSQRAVWLGGAAASLRESTGAAPGLEFRARHERSQGAARKDLGPRMAVRVWQEGHDAPPREAIAAALTQLTVAGHAPGEGPKESLTRREREVASLLIRGHSNREIATALVIGERTVEMHVGHILSKLGLSSRTQVAVWAIEHGL